MGLIAQHEIVGKKITKSPNTAKLLMSVLRLNKINSIYNAHCKSEASSFLDEIIQELHLSYDLHEEDLKNIPPKGPFIIVSNHPFGIIDGILLLKSILKVRPDFKVMANFVLQRIEPLDDYFFSVNPFESSQKGTASYRGIKQAMQHIKQGCGLGLFPAGEVSSFNKDFRGRTDRKWSESILKLVYNSGVPVIPVHFKGTNSWLFHLIGLLNPAFRTAKLPSEALNKKNKPIGMRIGRPIMPREQKEFEDYKNFGRHIRSIVYAMGNAIEPQQLFIPAWKKPTKQEPIAGAQNPEAMAKEVEQLKKESYKLFSINQYEAYCAPSNKLDSILYEIGRLREVTYREVGEGTNRAIDIDDFDSYYQQLFIWDSAHKKIVGGYRLGFGSQILDIFGRTGFYSHSLFAYQKDFKPILVQTIELGRSFIVKEYQRKSLSLFMLWKGILYTLLKNPEYRYLLGPVSISDEFSETSKKLIVDFVEKNHFSEQFSNLVKPRKKVRFKHGNEDLQTILEQTGDSLEKLDRTIKRIEIKQLSVPVLLKKYLELNGKIIGFNLDPAFNNCIDGLLLMDLFDIPVSVIQAFSKELKDNKLLSNILERKDIKKIITTRHAAI